MSPAVRARALLSPARRQHLFVAGRSLRAAGGTAFGLALAWFALVSLGSVTAFGVISGVSMAFSVAGALVCVLLARVDPRRLSVASLASQAFVLLVFGTWALATPHPSVGIATLLVALAALFAAIADPLGIVLIAAVGDAVAEQGHAPRGSVVSRSLSVPSMVGIAASAGGGVAITAFGPEAVILAAALLLAAGTAAIGVAVGLATGPVAPASSPWRAPVERRSVRRAATEVGGEVRRSVAWIRTQPWLAVRFVAYPLFWPLAGVSGFLIPTIAVGLGLSAALFGMAGSVMGVAQALLTARLGGHLGRVRPGIAAAIGVPGLWIASLILVGLAPAAPLFLAAMLLSRLAGTYNEAVWTAVFGTVPGDRRTMISALDWLTSQVLGPATRLVAPVVVLAVGAGPALAAFAAVATAGFAVCGLVGSRAEQRRVSGSLPAAGRESGMAAG